MRKKGAEKGHVQFILIERVHFFLNRTRLLFSKLNMFTFSKSGHVHFFLCADSFTRKVNMFYLLTSKSEL